MQEAFGFMFFSSIEAFSWYMLSLCLFRYRPFEFIWSALAMILVMNLQSFILRNELSLSNYAPLINILILIFYFAVIVRVPLIGSFIITLAGFAGFGIVQVVLTFLLFGSIEAAQSSLTNGYALQTATAIIVFLLAWIPYRLGYGIELKFEKLKFKFEEIVTAVLMICFLGVISTVLYLNNLLLLILLFGATLGYLLYFSIKKDRSIWNDRKHGL